MVRLLILIAFAVTLVTLPAMARADGRGLVTSNGRIGPVTVGKSRAAAVRRFAGQPSSVASGIGEGGVRFRRYRYRCGSRCSTQFFFNARGRLTNFITRSPRYHTSGGTRVGQLLADAQRQERKAATFSGCGGFFGITHEGRAELTISVSTQPPARVQIIAVAGRGSVLGC